MNKNDRYLGLKSKTIMIKRKEKWTENLYEKIMAENFPKMEKRRDI